jgi:serine/threonine-protein kinase RsbW
MIRPDAEPILEISVQSGALAARQLLQGLKQAVGPIGLAEDDIGKVEIVVAEVVNNIVEHAYEDNEGQGPITLTCTQGPKGLCIGIRDCGHPMPDGKAPEGAARDLGSDFDDLPEGGFGWNMIRTLTSDVQYARVNDENRLSIFFSLGA